MVRPVSCPICGKELPPESADPVNSKWFPFCSERCRNVDLLRWSEGRYAIEEPLTPERLSEEIERDEGRP
ncbi:MAG: DNA gyrase inhibitor YacG [Planctomycetota bacterium]